MRITRLRFLALLSSGFAFAAAGPARLFAASSGRGKTAYSAETFVKLINTTFTVHGPKGVVSLVLEDVKAGPQDPSTNQFSLLFAAPATTTLPEGTYPVNHSGFTNLSLFLGPAGTDQEGKALFRADFNLLR
jgi:hypothetical protein